MNGMKAVKSTLAVLIALCVLMSAALAIAGPETVRVWGGKLIFRDADGNEQTWVPATTVTPGTITVGSGGGGTPVTTTGTETLTNKTLTTPTINAGSDAQLYIGNGTSMELKSITGTLGITNAGVTSISTDLDADDLADSSVGSSEIKNTGDYTMNSLSLSSTLSVTGAITANSTAPDYFAIPIGNAPAATCLPGEVFIDTDETVDTNCNTTNDNSLCVCTAAGVWNSIE